MVTKRKLLSLFAVILAAGANSCTTETETDDIDLASGIRLTAIHTADIHSRLLPYDMDLMATDERLGMTQANEPFGGIARAATVIRQIRSQAQHSIHLDSGDVFQGAPIFNEFNGEPEILSLNYLGMDAFVIGNHEFDNGVSNLYDKLSMAQFTILAANYQWKPTVGNEYLPLKDIARPYTIVNADGIKVAIIGMANYSSMSSSTYGDNNLGITVLENIELVQTYLDLLKNDANILTMTTHLGLGEDEDVIRKTEGLDMVFGGHLHVVLNPPKIIPDGSKIQDPTTGELVASPKMVPLVHSGAFMKYVGHFEGVFYPDYMIRPERYVGQADRREWDLTLVSHKYEAIPIESNIADDAELTLLMAPYERELARRLNLRYIVGYAPQTLKRFGVGGKDSSLGNFLADAMITRQRVEADFSATNSLGIRTDILQGPVTNDQLYNVFPFPNTVASMTLSGSEVQSLLDYNTYRSMNRGCQSQLQVAGVRYTLDCHTAKRVVDDYLAQGYLFEYQYRADAFNELCRKTPRPSYCKLQWEDKENPQNNIYYATFAKDIRIVRGECERDSDCAYYDSKCADDRSTCIARCDEVIDTDSGSHKVCTELIQPQWFYKFATNNYMAHGGSGFSSLKYNTTQKETNVELRAVLIDSIEKVQSCIDRCKADDPNFNEKYPGTCKRLQNCKTDTTEFQLRWCKQMYKYSEQEVCLANADTDITGSGPSQCAGLSKKSQYDSCLERNYQNVCTKYFDTILVNDCLANAEKGKFDDVTGGRCEREDKSSPYTKCAAAFLKDAKYMHCDGLSTVSEYDKCAAKAASTAEGICMKVSCFIAGTDGRQNSERPRNEADGSISTNSFSNGPAIMEALQESGYDACY